MPTLRITQTTASSGHYRVQLALRDCRRAENAQAALRLGQ
jgi:hypothetical protein